MALRQVVLGLLVDRPDHAYALKHRLSPGLPRAELINDGALYPLLAKLEAEGLVEGSEERGPTGRLRRTYSVTAAGRAEFDRWLRSDDDEAGPPINELYVNHPLVKLLFASHLGRDRMVGKLERQGERVAERIRALESLASRGPDDPTGGFGRSLLELELRQLSDRLAWLRAMQDRI
jgi:DNA-binding PadR family transcriptional regulator